MAKVRITKAPAGSNSRKVRIAGLPNQVAPTYNPAEDSTPSFEVSRTLKAVPRDKANIEAEKGETVYMPDKDGLPAHFNIGGNRHSAGGTPLNVPKDSFVYSDTKKMRIKDPEILAEFGKSKGSYTPAELAKKYNINKYRKQLQDPDSDPIMVRTAEMMIANYNLKLGKLALVQEAKKGFPQGIPAAAMPYMATYNIGPDQVLPLKQETEDIPYEEVPQARFGMQLILAQDGYSVPKDIQAQLAKQKAEQRAIEQKIANDKKRFLQYQQSKQATAKVAQELKQKGFRNLQKTELEKKMRIAQAQLYPQWEDQALLDFTERKVREPNLIKNVPAYEKAVAAYQAFQKSNPDLFPNPNAGMSDGSFYFPSKLPNSANQFEEPVPQGGFPGFSPIRQSTTFIDNQGNVRSKADGLIIKKAAPAVTQTAVSDTIGEVELTPEEMIALGIQKFGGYFQDGGSTTVKRKLTPEQLAKLQALRAAKGAPAPVVRPTVKSKGTARPSGQTELWNPDFIASLQEKAPGSKVTLPEVFNEGTDTQRAANMQAAVKKSPNIYGKRDWSQPQYQDEFRKRHAWFFAQPENKDWSPNNKADVAKFQESYNKKAEKVGLKPFFIDDTIINAEKDPKRKQELKKFRKDSLFGDVTFSPPDLEAIAPTPVETPAAKAAVTSPGPVPNAPAVYEQQRANAPWWIQDVINTASAAGTRLGLKKYLPWAPQVHLQTPRPTFYDPTRELAANTEAMSIGTEGAGLFAGPQAFNARFSQIQGAGARNAANILSNYHNKNVGVANQFENIRTGILNKESMLNADVAHKLYDQTTVANQQFDNAKRQANAQLRESYVNALTNRAMAQTLNELYPHYQVDPISGGFTTFNRGSEMMPGRAPQTLAEQAAEINAAASQAGWTTDQMLDYMGKGSKQNRIADTLPQYNDSYDPRADYLRQRNMVVPSVGPYGYQE